MKRFRCTRNAPYTVSVGYNDWTARQGYYIRALNAQEAIHAMGLRFPDDTDGFTATENSGGTK